MEPSCHRSATSRAWPELCNAHAVQQNRSAERLKVVWHQPDPRTIPEELLRLLSPSIDIESSAEVGKNPVYEVLIGVSPPLDFFTASDELRFFVAAQAGFTPTARAGVLSRAGISVHNLHHNAAACAESAVALMLACAKNVVVADADLRAGRWDTRYSPEPQRVLRGSTAVIVGFGSIGRAVAPVCDALGMHVTGVRRSVVGDRDAARKLEVVGTERLDDVLHGADVMIITLPSTPETDSMIGAEQLDLLAEDAIVVNVGRAGQIDEQALYERLVSGRIGGAGLDVWPIEPTIEQVARVTMPSKLPFHELPNVVMSPHKAGWLPHDDTSKFQALAEILNCIAAGLDPPNKVNPVIGY